MPPDDVASLKDQVNEMKLSINDLENQVETLNKTVGELVQELKTQAATRVEKAKEWATLKSQHETCMAERLREKSWLTGRIGALVDKFLPLAITAAVMYLVMKGGKP